MQPLARVGRPVRSSYRVSRGFPTRGPDRRKWRWVTILGTACHQLAPRNRTSGPVEAKDLNRRLRSVTRPYHVLSPKLAAGSLKFTLKEPRMHGLYSRDQSRGNVPASRRPMGTGRNLYPKTASVRHAQGHSQLRELITTVNPTPINHQPSSASELKNRGLRGSVSIDWTFESSGDLPRTTASLIAPSRLANIEVS